MTDDDRLGPPPIEPMSDVAWSRVERGLWSRLDAEGPQQAPPPVPPSRRWWMVGVPVVAAVAAAVVALVLRPGVSVDGRSRVETIASGSSVSFGESYIEIDAYSALELDHESGRPTVLLERGAAWFTVAPREGRSEFVVRAGDAMVRVVGTRFRVARSEEQIAVDVDRGVVAVQFRGGLIEVGANQRWSSATPARISTLGLSPIASPIATGEPNPEPTPEPIDKTDETAPQPVAPKRPAKPAKRDVNSAPRPEPNSAPRPEPRRDDPGLEAARAADDLERREYERLARLEPIRPQEALNGYLALARGTSRWSDLALFAAARLAADRKDRRAESLLVRYLQQFPSGANAADARQLLVRLKSDHP